MPPVKFEITLEFTLNGRRYRTDPAKVTARPVLEPEPSATPQEPTNRGLDPPRPQYALRKGLGVWRLTFEGRDADIKHERGIFYVAWLLTHPPPLPIHALDLISKIPEIYRHQLGLAQITDPATGSALTLETASRLQERSLSLDNAQSLRALLRKQKELEAILDDESESEPVKQEALRELEAIAEFQKQHGRRTQTNAHRAADSVRKAIIRFHDHLALAKDADGNPHPVLVPFADHLLQYLRH